MIGVGETAVRELERIRSAGVDPALLRWCRWPGCWHSYDATNGPVGDPGWVRAARYLLLCPRHAIAGHLPRTRIEREPSSLFIDCECGESFELGGKADLDDAHRRWAAHVAEATANVAVNVAVSEYTVSAYPDPESDWWRHFALYVRHVGAGMWVVSPTRDGSPREYMDVDGQVTFRPEPEFYEHWLTRTRFTERDALALARWIAPDIMYGPLTIADAVAREQQRNNKKEN